MQRWQSQLDVAKVPIACLQRLSTCVTEPCLHRYAQPQIQWAIFCRRSISRQVVEISIAYFKHALLYDILGRTGCSSALFRRPMKGTHPMPNLSSLIRLGIVSTTCSFTDSVVVAIATCQSYRYRRAHKGNILWWNSSCMGADSKVHNCFCGLLLRSVFDDLSSFESQLELFPVVGYEGLASQGSGANGVPITGPPRSSLSHQLVPFKGRLAGQLAC